MKLSCELKCGVVLQRDELSVHEKRCPQRIVKCEHCRNNFKSCELAMHLEMCPKMEVSCELKCGVVMCREDVAQHVEQDCVEKEIECPFAKYKCVVLMKRKNLRNHLDEKRIEHLELQVDTMQECMLEDWRKKWKFELSYQKLHDLTGKSDEYQGRVEYGLNSAIVLQNNLNSLGITFYLTFMILPTIFKLESPLREDCMMIN